MNDPINAGIRSEMPEAVEVDAVELRGIELRLSGVKDATQRSRFVFVVMTIVAATILMGLWNSLLAWDREMAFYESKDPSSLVAENQKIVRTEWLKNLNISVGLLGIRVGPYDLAVIGSSSLIVVMFWFFFSQRRENRAIVGLLRYCKTGYDQKELSQEVCNWVYAGIVQSIVFIDMGGGDRPIEGLEVDESHPLPNVSIRRILTALVYLPPITIGLIIIADMFSLIIPSYQRDSEQALWRTMLDGQHTWAVIKIVVFELFAIWACHYTWRLCRKCREFSKATAKTIKDYKSAGLAGE